VSEAGREALVLGGQGAAGAAIVAAFGRAGWRVRSAGRRPGADCRVDLDRPETLAEAMRGVDVVVNTVPHPELAAERTVLECGGLLLNVADRSPGERSVLRELRGTRGTVVLNWGVIPGVAGLAGAELVRRHPEADAIELAVVFSAAGTSGVAGGEFLHRELSRVRRHGTATIALPPPFGARTCLEFAEGQEGWMGSAAAGRAVRSYVRLAEPAMTPALLALNRVGAMGVLPRAAFVWRRGRGHSVSGEPFAVSVTVRAGERRLAATAIHGAGMYRCTANAAVAGAGALLERASAGGLGPGCLDPDEVFELGELESDLREAGLTVRGG
jgi:hypothetical protein